MFRSPFIEAFCIADPAFLEKLGLKLPEEACEVLRDPINFLNTKYQGRRVIKSHLPFQFLPPKLLDTCKVVYVARNPKDCATSFYHHNLNVKGHSFVGNFEEFLRLFEDGLSIFGGYWDHLRQGWARRDHPNLKFLWFENMKVDQRVAVDELCEFLNHPLSEELKGRLCEHVKFDNMKKSVFSNFSAGIVPPEKQFVRKGEVGDWRNHFNDETDEKWNKWIDENVKGTGLENVPHFKQEK